MLNKLSLLMLVVLFSACSSSLKVNPGTCRTRGVWKNVVESDFDVSKKVYIFGKSKEIYLKNFLEESSVDCNLIGSLEMNIEQGFFDSILFFVPYISSYQISIKGQYKYPSRTTIDSD